MKKILSIILALALCLIPLTAFAAVTVPGDVDGDGEATSSDARMALRKSVGLETFNATQTRAADVDFDGTVTSSDARLILRASVGLETLTTKDLYFNGHLVANDSITVENGIVCIDPDCSCGGATLMPSFNALVNALKTPGSLNYFSGFTKTVSSTPKPTCKPTSTWHLGLAELMEGLLADSVEAETITDFTDFTKRRHVNNATFFVAGKSYVSALSDSDVKSVTMTKMSGVDFIKALPSSVTSTESSEVFDLTQIKAATKGDVYKVTVTLNPEKITAKNIPTTTTPIEKILNAGYNNGIKGQMNSLDNSFNSMPEMAGMFVMEMEITTACTVDYYFTADTFQPVAARYVTNMDTTSYMHTYFNLAFTKTDSATTTTTIKNNTVQENYFFFNGFAALQ